MMTVYCHIPNGIEWMEGKILCVREIDRTNELVREWKRMNKRKCEREERRENECACINGKKRNKRERAIRS